jgi:hypothetical protein
MSILDHGPHTVIVHAEETAADSRGNVVKRPAVDGVTVTDCLVTPVGSSSPTARSSVTPGRKAMEQGVIAGDIAQPIALDSFLDPRFTEAANAFDRAEVDSAAQRWLQQHE